MERIFVLDKETRLLGFLHPGEADYKKVEAMAAFLGLCQKAWQSGTEQPCLA